MDVMIMTLKIFESSLFLLWVSKKYQITEIKIKYDKNLWHIKYFDANNYNICIYTIIINIFIHSCFK